MSLNQENINELLIALSKKESSFKKRTIIYIIVLIFFGAAWLIYTNMEVANLKSKSDDLQAHIVSLDSIILTKEKDIAFLETTLHESDNFKTSKITIDPIAIKTLSFSNQLGKGPQELFIEIKELQDRSTKFNSNGKTPEDGFSSSAMISFVLKKKGYLKSVTTNASQLSDALPTSNGKLKSGDIIIYKSGYAMLYIRYVNDSNNTDVLEFVIGMTPFGILELKPDFTEKLKVLRPNY